MNEQEAADTIYNREIPSGRKEEFFSIAVDEPRGDGVSILGGFQDLNMQGLELSAPTLKPALLEAEGWNR